MFIITRHRFTEKERGKTIQPLIISAWHTRCDGVAARWLLPPARLHLPFKITQKMKSVCHLYQLRPSSQYTTDSSIDINEMLLLCFPGQPISHLSVGTRNRQRLWSASQFLLFLSLLALSCNPIITCNSNRRLANSKLYPGKFLRDAIVCGGIWGILLKITQVLCRRDQGGVAPGGSIQLSTCSALPLQKLFFFAFSVLVLTSTHSLIQEKKASSHLIYHIWVI